MKNKTEQVTLSADIIIEFEDGSLVFVERGNPPFKGSWALPGGLMDEGETIEETAVREALEETGLKVKLTGLIGVYSQPDRDPRGRYVSVAFSAIPVGGELKAGDDAKNFLKTAEYAGLQLAFDHNQIIADYKALRKS